MNKGWKTQAKKLFVRVGAYEIARKAWRHGMALVNPHYRQLVQQDQRLKNLYGQFVRPGSLCYDVGANYGNRTLLMLDLGAKVVSIEPQRQCIDALQMRYGHHKKVQLVQQGLGDAPGTMTLHMDAKYSGIASISQEFVAFGEQTYEKRKYGSSYQIPITTFDAVIAQYGLPDFTKIDVEGAEIMVLRGLTQPIPALCFEYTPGLLHLTEACIERLMSLGEYEFNYTVLEEHTLKLEKWVRHTEIMDVLHSGIAASQQKVMYGDMYARLRLQ